MRDAGDRGNQAVIRRLKTVGSSLSQRRARRAVVVQNSLVNEPVILAENVLPQ